MAESLFVDSELDVLLRLNLFLIPDAALEAVFLIPDAALDAELFTLDAALEAELLNLDHLLGELDFSSSSLLDCSITSASLFSSVDIIGVSFSFIFETMLSISGVVRDSFSNVVGLVFK